MQGAFLKAKVQFEGESAIWKFHLPELSIQQFIIAKSLSFLLSLKVVTPSCPKTEQKSYEKYSFLLIGIHPALKVLTPHQRDWNWIPVTNLSILLLMYFESWKLEQVFNSC